MDYDILSVYGDVRLEQNICKECGCRFFILDKTDYSDYCPDCRCDGYGDTKNLNTRMPKAIYHTPLYKRKYIPKKIRLAIYKRDNYKCVYCDRDLYEDFLFKNGKITVDHFIPYVGRGKDDIKNLFTACKRCNSAKFSTIFKSIEEVREFIKNRKTREHEKTISN